ncbi:AhpC-TSA-domain-containing protein [Tilletiaria anomala UBC 951]|uniref:thioredoxin-dependent peroxiredoxin n=1 Tax=Tilletiaria anomala (strain ATCC 24038 / CBS 436.72 / UBC 951) TaxID=1037660 RepID=A0A066VK44_TILAU|nr:AhpC-TSA-domain-containing protein [Tilletiaria anomala UBC 951]KDN38935.1 AhpC-TSA-domain-containing protein [Tilletiaria anomala UBC 951]
MPPKPARDGERRSARQAAAKPAASVSSIPSKEKAETKKRAAGSADVPPPSSKKTKVSKSIAKGGAAIITVGNGTAGGKLKVGDKLPQGLILKTQEEKEVKVGELKKCVLFSYPKANTPGCTNQACLFRDAYQQYVDEGFTVYGLSNDNPTPLKTWKTKQKFQYDLLSDPQRALIGALTGSKSSTMRSHFVIDADCKLALSSISVKPKESSDAVLDFIKEKKASR